MSECVSEFLKKDRNGQVLPVGFARVLTIASKQGILIRG